MTSTARTPRFLLTSDVGGTFTDTVLLDLSTGRTWATKVPSRDRRQEEAVRDGVKEAVARFVADVEAKRVEGVTRAELDGLGPLAVHHGSTVATNALLERRGARTALVTNAGFEDLLEIRRQDRVDLYDLSRTRPEPLVPREARYGLPCRRGPHGEDWGEGPDALRAALEALAPRLREDQVEAVAVGFLHADLHPDDERVVATWLREALPGVAVVASHEVWPEMREVERFETTVLNAYLLPLMGPYLERLERALDGAADRVGGVGAVRILDSAGTLTATAEAARRPASLLLSGPAGGVAAAAGLSSSLGLAEVVSFDVGGTSTDVAYVSDGVPTWSTGARVAGFSCRFPAVEVHTLGAGGGSVLWRDAGGHLQAGPRSQGAYPGPACYGRGGEDPTLTDALLLVGRIPPGLVFGGRTKPDRKAAFRVLERLAQKMRLSLQETALGAVRIAVEATAGGVQVVTTHRGQDPRNAALMAFGGAGPLLGAELAEAVGMKAVVVPWEAGAFSARGMAAAPLVVRRAAGLAVVVTSEDEGVVLADAWQSLAAAMGAGEAIVGRVAARYVGQSHELELVADATDRGAVLHARFEAAHAAAFGHVHSGRDVELVRLLVERVTALHDPGWGVAADAVAGEDRPSGLVAEHPVWVRGSEGVAEERTARVVWRSELAPGARLPGPAVVADATATAYVPPGWTATVDAATRALFLRRAEVGA